MSFRSGYPQVSIPRAADRDTQNVFGVIRQRLGQLDAEVVRIASIQSTGLSTQQDSRAIADLVSQITELSARVSALESGGATETAVFAEAVAQFEPVSMSSPGTVVRARADNADRAFALYGIALASTSPGTQGVVQRSGTVTIPGAGFIALRPVYVGASGGLTQTPPTAQMPAGVAVSTTTLLIASSATALTSAPFSDVDDDMPVTFGMVRDAIALATAFALQPNGIVVKVGTNDIRTRVLIGGRWIDVLNQDGIAGDPIIDYNPSSPTGYPPP